MLAAGAAMAVSLVQAAPAAVGSARLPKPRPALDTDAPAIDKRKRATIDSEPAATPRPRPPIDARPEIADWAESVGSHFEAASSNAKSAPAARRRTVTLAATSPLPETDEPSPVAHVLEAIDDLAPLPRPRPNNGHELALMMPPSVAPVSPSLIAPEDAGCIDRIRALGVEFTEEPPMDVGGNCSVPHPLKVTNLGSGIAVGPETILNCAETESLALWVKDVVVPSATKLLGSAPNRITQDSAYVCRTRYNDPQQKISEHAHANALDVASFSFADRDPVSIGGTKSGSPEAKFEAEIRKGACDHFTTVLGPGSNAAHATHFHLDMQFRRGGYRLCELGGPTTVAAPAKTKRE
jgi:hypothetical protein